jgi:hypothetical protein
MLCNLRGGHFEFSHTLDPKQTYILNWSRAVEGMDNASCVRRLHGGWDRMNDGGMDAPITINGKAPNFFRGLLSYRPRAGGDSRENFLTEAFAYVLAMDPSVAMKIIEAFVEDRFEVKRLVSISTQVSLRDETSWGLPDMKIEVLDRDNQRMQLWIENKWGAFADPDQLTRYLGYLERQEPAVPKHLVLLTPRHTDAKVCPVSKSKITLTHMSWSKIHEVVTAHRAHAITNEFEAFLSEQQLVVQPITLAAAREHYRKVKAKEDWSVTRLRKNLETLCNRVLDALPKTELSEDAHPIDNWGRVGLWMFGDRVTLGLMHDPYDHASAFLDKARPLDLIVRVEGRYKKAEAAHERANLAPLVRALEKAGYACDQGNWRANKHTVLLGHYREGFPFDVSADEQVHWVLDVFTSTLSVIGHNGSLMKLLREVRHWQ